MRRSPSQPAWYASTARVVAPAAGEMAEPEPEPENTGEMAQPEPAQWSEVPAAAGVTVLVSVPPEKFGSMVLGALRGLLTAEITARASSLSVLLPLSFLDYHDGLDACSLDELGITDGSKLALGTTCASTPPVLAEVTVAPATSKPTPPANRKRLAFATREAIKNASLILEPWLFVSGDMAAKSKAALKQLNIGFVLNCCERIPFAFVRGETENLMLAMPDQRDADIAPHLPAAFAFMDRAKKSGRGCLVHCMVGASRSVTVVLAFLMEYEGMTLRDAWTLVKQKRRAARPNRGFALQLMEMERQRNDSTLSTGVCRNVCTDDGKATTDQRGETAAGTGASNYAGVGSCTVRLEDFDKRYSQ